MNFMLVIFRVVLQLSEEQHCSQIRFFQKFRKHFIDLNKRDFEYLS